MFTQVTSSVKAMKKRQKRAFAEPSSSTSGIPSTHVAPAAKTNISFSGKHMKAGKGTEKGASELEQPNLYLSSAALIRLIRKLECFCAGCSSLTLLSLSRVKFAVGTQP